jgi:thiamine pyrophosphate-dependent acetolactate synthase large subunit-like protein
MDKSEAIAVIINAAVDTPVVFTTGYACRIAQSIDDRDSNFYMTGSMGLAATIGTGISLALNRTVVVVDGDGSLAMNPGCLLTAGAVPDLRLLHVVLDDGAYASTGGQISPTQRVDFCALARSAGYVEATQVVNPLALTAWLETRLDDCDAPTLAHCAVSEDKSPPPPRIDTPLAGHAQRFARYLQQWPKTTNR